MEEKIIDLEKQILKTDKMIQKAKRVRSLIINCYKNLDDKYTYSTSKFLRGNIFGDFMRNSRVKSINNNIGKVQDALLKFEADLLIFDKDLASVLKLPAKMQGYGRVEGKLADISLRTDMRFRQFDVAKSLKNLDVVIKRLLASRKRMAYDLKNQKELLGYK